MRFTFRLAFRRSFSSSYDCDPYIISSGSLLGSGNSWTAECVNYPGYSSQCNSVIIGSTGFRCTDYSSSEDWSMGENNFTHTFSSIHDEWIVRQVFALLEPINPIKLKKQKKSKSDVKSIYNLPTIFHIIFVL